MIISAAKLNRETIASSPVTLPDELISNVLSLLKVKSLVRFKCVNKSWNSLISDPFFVKMHLIKSSQNQHVILSFLSTSSIALLNPFLIRSLLENPSINIINHDSIYKLTKRNCQIIGTCNGLTCLVNYWETEFYLWNPATKWFSQKLTSFHHFSWRDIDFLKFSFGYDNLTHKYKLMAFHSSEVRILTLGDNVWRNTQNFPSNLYKYISNHANAGVYLSNSLNWFALRDNILLSNQYLRRYLSVQQFVIISFDLGIETYTQFMLPQGFDQVPVVPPIVCRLKECLCFSHYSSGVNFVIWQMKEFGVEESWTKLLKFDYHNILHTDFYEAVNLLPLHVFENGDILILAPNLKQLICYNWRENRVVRQATVTDTNIICKFSVSHYVESLVSTY